MLNSVPDKNADGGEAAVLLVNEPIAFELPAERRRRRFRRIIIAGFCVDILIFLVLAVVYRGEIRRYWKPTQVYRPRVHVDSGARPWTPQGHTRPINCYTTAEDEPLGAVYKLPLGQDTFQFVGRGPFDGTVTYRVGHKNQKDFVTVAVTTHKTPKEDLEGPARKLRICGLLACDTKELTGMTVSLADHGRHRHHHDDDDDDDDHRRHRRPPSPPPRAPHPPPPPHGPPHPPHHPHEPGHREPLEVEEIADPEYVSNLIDETFDILGLEHGSLIKMDVVITLPVKFWAQSFVSIFPTMAHIAEEGALEKVEFNGLVAVTRNATLHNIRASKGVIIGTQGGLNGSYEVDDRLSLIAHSAPLIAKIKMISSEDSERPTKLEMINNDGLIDAQIVLNLTHEENEWRLLGEYPGESDRGEFNGSYRISSVTKSAPNVVEVLEQPVGSLLKLESINRGAASNVTLPAAYEGKFELINGKGGKSHVAHDEETEDPSGEGRVRKIKVDTVINDQIITGHIDWLEKEDLLVEEGFLSESMRLSRGSSVEVVTSNEDSHLFFA